MALTFSEILKRHKGDILKATPAEIRLAVNEITESPAKAFQEAKKNYLKYIAKLAQQREYQKVFREKHKLAVGK
jgi:hypothetical protein